MRFPESCFGRTVKNMIACGMKEKAQLSSR